MAEESRAEGINQNIFNQLLVNFSMSLMNQISFLSRSLTPLSALVRTTLEVSVTKVQRSRIQHTGKHFVYRSSVTTNGISNVKLAIKMAQQLWWLNQTFLKKVWDLCSLST